VSRRAGLVVCLLVIPAAAFAQPHRGSIEVGGGIVWTGGYDAGSAAANETRNPSTGSTPLTLFLTSSRMLGAIGVDARAGVYVARRVLVEGTFAFSRPVLRAHLSGDFEGAIETDADTNVSTYIFGAAVTYGFGDGRVVPFASAGAGRIRQVPEGGDVLTGVEAHAAGGVTYALTHGRHPLGIRGEIAVSSRSRSVAFEQKHRVVPGASAGLTWRF
jgi:opacity protein-like surface antigen